MKAGQFYNCSEYKIIGLSMYHFTSGSGYDQSLSFNASIEKDRKHLEGGLIMQLGSGRISGGEVIYRQYLSPVYKSYGQNQNFRFYLQLNLIFREHLLISDPGSIPVAMHQEAFQGRKVPTFEQYAGAGAMVRIHNNLFVNASLGYGLIMGSADNYQVESSGPVSYKRYDHGMSAKFGLGYFFKR
ncbi:MAG: hypothetical protein EA408_10505 [Marinilabiliales bacterium]|nr:MAG: hypothetical protein EA408_10505 [Marinilabiliales bacterium]